METLIKAPTDWWKEEVVYQIYPKSFRDGNDDGIGDLPGIIEKLDYLQSLGVTMLWISPIFQSPMADNGYDISDYQAINPEFGTMEDFDILLGETKKRNMKIILDLVVNHTSDEHEWFQQALADPYSPYRDYYIFQQGQEGGTPNNWRSIFGGSVWEPVPGEENTYYFHTFDKKQPDLNWESPLLRQEIYDMINWWLEKGLDGFRVDAITFIKKDQDYASLPPDGADGLASVKYKGRNRPGIEKFLKEMNERTFQNYCCVTVGEAPGVRYEEYGQFIGEEGYFNMIFDFHYADIDVKSGSEWFRRTDWTIAELKEKLFTSQEALQGAGWGANFLENHDQPRSLSKYIRDPEYRNTIGAKALGAMFFFLRGTPFIYQGQEIGMTNFERDSLNDFNDLSSIDNYYRSLLEGYGEREALAFVNQRSRDNARTPFQWNRSEKAGFSESAEPWLKIADDNKAANVYDQQDNPHSLLNFYRELIRLRNQSEHRDTLIYGKIIPLKTPDHVIGYCRKGEAEIISYTNLCSTVQYAQAVQGPVLLNNYEELVVQDELFALQPYQTILIKKGE